MNQFVNLDEIILPDQPAVLEILNVAGDAKLCQDTAEINAGSLLAMCKTLRHRAKSDVSESLLFAQLAADAAYDKFSNPKAWMGKLIDVMEMLGWRVLQELSYGRRNVFLPECWKSVALSAFERGYGGPARLVQRMMQGASTIDPDAPGSKLWNTHGTDGLNGHLLVGHVNADGSDDPVISLMCANFKTEFPTRGILSGDAMGQWSDDFLVLTLNTDVYDPLRSQIAERLGPRVNTDIDQIAL